MQALLTRAGVVADLVAAQPRRAEALDGESVHRGLGFVIKGLEFALSEATGHHGAGLIGEVVAGDVRCAEGDGPVEVRPPFVERLARNGEDQVERAAPDARRPGDLERSSDAVGVVPALEGLEVVGPERLRPDAHPVHAAADQHIHQFGRDRLRIALHGELAGSLHVRAVKQLAQATQHARPQRRPQQAGGAAAGEDRLKRPGVGRQHGQLKQQPLHERLLLVVGVDKAVKVAVVALVEAERHMDVERPHGVVHAAQRPRRRLGRPR